jgi:mannose-6-phosphate isomerase-like protein (cupin superfamily)
MPITPFIIREADCPAEGWDDPVRGKVGWRTLMSGDRTPTEGFTCGIAELYPDVPLSLHRHAPPEIYLILSGQGIVSIDGVETEVGPMTAIFIPGDAVHGVRNTGSETLRLFYSFAVDSFHTVAYDFNVG